MGRRAKQLREELERLQIRAAKWGRRYAETLANCEPVCPPSFDDRQADISEPLIAICDVLGGEWPERIRKALLPVFASPAAEDTSKRVVLLGHIRKVFLDKYDAPDYDYLNPDQRKLRTGDLLERLCEIEDAPWSEWSGGKKLTGYGLSKLLKPFEIRSKSIRDGDVVRGYTSAQFLDAFGLYLQPVCSCKGCKCHEACSGLCSGSENAVSVNVDAGCSGVAAKTGGKEEGAKEAVN